MNQEITNPQAMLDTIIHQETALQFDAFTAAEGWALGLAARQAAMAHGGNIAVDVTLGGVQVFRCTVGEATPNNTRWIRRKANVTLESWKSSLRMMLELQLSDRSAEEFGWSAADYVLAGGCFPIRVRGTGVVGTLTVSGLPQTHDHQVAADALASYLGIAVPSILA